MFLQRYLIAKFEICVLTTLTRPQFSKVKICAIGYLYKHTIYFISAHCSFQVSERPSEFAVDGRIVIVMSA